MKLILPQHLTGRIFRPRKHPRLARLGIMLNPTLSAPPAYFDGDAAFVPGYPSRIYLNSNLGDCVMAARANQQTRLVAAETNSLINITDAEVDAEYISETGGPDTGLVPEDSLELWRTRGWIAAGNNHKITAWARVDATNRAEVMQAVFLMHGMQLGMSMPLAWQDLLNAGEPWRAPQGSEVNDPRWRLGSWGGHQVVGFKYDNSFFYPETWGTFQPVTWDGLAWIGNEANGGEAEAVVSADTENVDVDQLVSELDVIAEAA